MLTPRQASERLSLARRKFAQQAEAMARETANQVGSRATQMPYMRHAVNASKGTADVGSSSIFRPGHASHGTTQSPRSPSDNGPLRIVSTRLRKSILPGGTFRRPEAIENVFTTGFRLRLEKGSKVPYAATHEYGDPKRGIRARPYIKPAANETRRNLARKYAKQYKDLVVTSLRGG